MSYVRGLVESWFRAVATVQGRRVLIAVFCVDAPFAFVFLVALQTYFRPQHLAGSAVPGLCLALYGGGKLVAQYAAGKVTDRLGAKTALRIGLGVIAGALTVLLAAPGLHALVLPASALYGIGAATVWPAIFGQANAMPPAQRAQITSAMSVTTGASLGAAVGLGMLLPETFPFRAAVLVSLLVVVAALALRGETIAGAPAEANSGARRLSLRALIADQAYVRLAVVFLLQSLALAALLSVFRAVGRDLFDASLRDEMLLLVPAGVAFGGGIGLAGLIGRVEARRQMLALAFLAGGSGFIAATQVDGRIAAVVLLAGGCFGLGLAIPTTTAASLDVARSTPGALFGFLLTLEGLGQALGPAIGAVLADTRSVLALVGVSLLIACAAAAVPVEPAMEPIVEGSQEVSHAG